MTTSYKIQAQKELKAQKKIEREAEALEHLKREVEKLRLEVRGDLRRATRGAWPKPGLGDVPYWAEQDGDSAENSPEADVKD